MKIAPLFSGLMLQQNGFLFASDKIYSVGIVIVIIWLGVLCYLALTSRKISKLEKELRQVTENAKNTLNKKG